MGCVVRRGATIGGTGVVIVGCVGDIPVVCIGVATAVGIGVATDAGFNLVEGVGTGEPLVNTMPATRRQVVSPIAMTMSRYGGIRAFFRGRGDFCSSMGICLTSVEIVIAKDVSLVTIYSDWLSW